MHVPDGSPKAESVYVTDAAGNVLWNFAGMTSTNVYLPSPSDELKSWYFTESPRVIPSEYGYSGESDEPLQGWEFDSDAVDTYVFLPGGSYSQFTSDYVKLTGRSEMVSLQMLGFWDSRYYAYTADTALQQIKDYTDRGYAIDVLVIDTDWRNGTSGSGYEINTDLFPNMAEFLEDCHDLGVNVCFNDHPDPLSSTENSLDKEEVQFRKEHLTLLLSLGLDYWWYDRNWTTALKPIDEELSVYAFGMYAYNWVTDEYLQSIKDLNGYAERALMMSNIDGCQHGVWTYASDITAHRYSIQWTGDIHADEDDLAQEIYASIFGSAEVGIPYISSDLGGHNQMVTNELYGRWFQYGALSAICRVHCMKNMQGQPGRMPWIYGETAEEIAHTYQDMRYRLLPLYYELARENYDTGLPIVRRLDIVYPQYAEASRNDEYLLGDYILVAPIATAEKDENGVVSDTRTVFFPDGVWIDVWSGERYRGPCEAELTYPIETSPVFVREGALVEYESAFFIKDVLSWQNARTAVLKAGRNDVNIVCVGTGDTVEYEGGDRQSLRLPAVQEQAILDTAAQNPNTVVVIFVGGAIDVSPWIDRVKAVVYAGFTGEGGDEVVADVLTGKINPSGKLSETFPLSLEDVPAANTYKCAGVTRYQDGLDVGYRYYDTYEVPVAFPFGHGLSYSSFAYSGLTAVREDDVVKVCFEVENTSRIDGKEIAEVYVRECAPLVYRPLKELKGYAKEAVGAGKRKKFCVELPMRAFAHWSTAIDRWEVTEGDYEILIGASSEDIRLRARLTLPEIVL